MVAWPSTLPQSPLIQGYSEQPQSQVISTTMDAGPTKTRRRFTASTRNIQATYRLTKDQVAIFEDWFEIYISGGAIPFEIPHPITGDTITALIIGSPPYTLSPVNSTDFWDLQINMEVQP